jgi:hypothetical protein
MQAVGSREYKLMLRSSKFNGDEEKLLASAGSSIWPKKQWCSFAS